MDGMVPASSEQIRTLARGIGLRQIRLVSGMILFAYVLSHFLNHALGNISLDATADGVKWHTAFWQFLPVAIAFYTAALLHCGLGIWALYQRRQFSRTAIEPLQLLLGLSIPALIIAHVTSMRLGQALYGQEKLYPQVLYGAWVTSPARIWLMAATILVAWIHGSWISRIFIGSF